jgi:hypothetical protein
MMDVTDLKLAAIDAELASDRGEIYDPASNAPKKERVILGMGRQNVKSIIDDAEAFVERKEASKKGFSLKALFGGGPKERAKDYTLEFDPITGGSRRRYVIEL